MCYVHVYYVHACYVHVGYVHACYVHVCYVPVCYVHVGYVHVGYWCSAVHCFLKEACAVGINRAINEDDAVITAYRSHGWTYIRGVSVEGVLAELTGIDTDM